ncbi:NAD(P)H-dependent oxidoreductase [Chitinophaga silvisoli]|uniref:NAD(P)H-dependent oxidoreductase n=1 Tax=Chitinophaga silvisoli TaxID=2291814 RepID=A0A3E1P1I8_9BACT|nr:NAD(P)H-dependent oxidoreductase [Chitinophaga silvisoli]RFM34049.1 NAD(P)H-dependent oxidoreductase [Chitinophaga silvisoli]
MIEQLKWRYAVKKYDSSKKVDDEQIALLQEVIRLSPSSHGLQPYKVLFISDPVVRERLRAVSFNQSQVTDAAVLVVFAIETMVDVDHYFDHVCKVRNMQLEGNLLHHKNNVAANLQMMTAVEKQHWATNQAYIALGNLLFAAAQLGIDANPMEGFVAAKYDEVLGLKDLHTVVIAGIGYRHEQDHFQRFIKVRKPVEELFINI